MLLEVSSESLRPEFDEYDEYSGQNTDILIITMKTNGQIVSAQNINMQRAAISLHIGSNSAFAWQNYFVFAGYSYGFYTRMQDATNDPVSPQYDSFVFKYDPSGNQDCLY